jgi:hypothetical protein
MMLHPTATDVLGRVVAFNDFLSNIQDNLRIPPERRTPQTHNDLVDSWTRFLAEAMSLREDLWATSRGRKDEWRAIASCCRRTSKRTWVSGMRSRCAMS